MVKASINEKTLAGTSWRGSDGVTRSDEPTQTSGERGYVSVHNHTTFSFLDGFGLPEQHAEQAAALGMKALAITDHGSVSGFVQHRDACNARGVKPLYGCELYTGPTGFAEATQSNPLGQSRRKNHLTVLCENLEGYRNLNQMVTRSWDEGYYQFPTVTGNIFADHHEGLVVLSGCTASLLSTSLVGGKNIEPADASYERGLEVARKFKDLLGDRYYLEVQAFPELDDVCAINQALERIGQELDIPLVCTTDVHVPSPDNASMRAVLHAIGRGHATVNEAEQEWNYDIDAFLPLDDDLLVEKLAATGLSVASARQAVAATLEVADRCTVELPIMPHVRYQVGPETTSEEMFMQWLRDGWKARGIGRMPKAQRDEYADRVKYETDIILKKDFQDYFLVVADMVRFAKGEGIAVGPGRGSVAGSLVAWLLGITEVNPMLYPHLVFERFIDITREDLPDIDLDFDSRRHEVHEYLIRKYGEEHVGQVATWIRYKGKNSLDDIARVYQIPKYEVDSVKELMIERSGGDLRADATIEDTVDYFDTAKEVFERHPDLWQATQLEGNIKGIGIHAAGLIVSAEPITDVCAVYTRGSGANRTRLIAMDKYDAEKVGLMKLDNLGLSTMDVLNYCRQQVGMTLDELYNIPLDDQATIDGFQANDVTGIFQFDGWAMQLVNSILKPDSFLEVCDVGALARPGPLHNGSVNEYVAVKLGEKEPRRYHPLVDEITKATNYQIVYQEQILRIVMEVGGFDWTHAAHIRKIISRRMGEQEFNRQGDRFMAGALERGLSEEAAKEVWGACITAGSYAFNSSHAVSYGLLGWWTMWFKQHHPAVFFAACLRYLGSGGNKQERLMQDAHRHGVSVLPPDFNESDVTWTPTKDGDIRAGFSQIHGVGSKIATAMVEHREDYEVTSWEDFTRVKGIGPKTIANIVEFVSVEDPFGVFTLERRLTTAKQLIGDGELPLPMPTHTSSEIPYQATGANMPVIWIGTIFHRNLRDLFEVNMSRTGVPLDPTKVKDPDKREWVIMYGRDDTDHMYISVDRWRYPKLRETIWDIELDYDLVVVRGIKKGNQIARRIYVKDLWVIDPGE